MSDETTLPETTPPQSTDTAPENGGAGKTFTEAELERIVKERLERQKRSLEAQQAKAADEAKAAALKEQGEFKTLYEQAQAKAAELEQRIAAQERDALRRKAAKAAGLDPDDAYLVSRLHGETEEELVADAKQLAERMKPAAPPAAPPRGGTPPGRTPPITPPRPGDDVGPRRPDRPLAKF